MHAYVITNFRDRFSVRPTLDGAHTQLLNLGEDGRIDLWDVDTVKETLCALIDATVNRADDKPFDISKFATGPLRTWKLGPRRGLVELHPGD